MSKTCYYAIRPKCGSNLALSVDLNNPNGNLIVNTLPNGTPGDEMLWQLITVVTPGTNYPPAAVNRKTGLAIYAGQGEAAVTQVPFDQVIGSSYDPSRCTWNLPGVAQGNYGAFQLSGDGSQNLNVLGDGPYGPGSQVGVWDWEGGGDNESWICTPYFL